MLIIFAAGLRSSGSTVQYQIARELIESRQLGEGFIYNRRKQKRILDTFNSNKILVVKQHAISKAYFKRITDTNTKILMTVRDPRDIVCSLMHRWNCSYEHVIHNEFLLRFIDQQQSWSQYKHITYLARYEDWHNDLQHEVLNIAEFLNINIDNHQACLIAHKFSLQENFKRLRNHITDGIVGKYKIMLTQEQALQIKEMCYTWMCKYNYIKEN